MRYLRKLLWSQMSPMVPAKHSIPTDFLMFWFLLIKIIMCNMGKLQHKVPTLHHHYL